MPIDVVVPLKLNSTVCSACAEVPFQSDTSVFSRFSTCEEPFFVHQILFDAVLMGVEEGKLQCTACLYT